MYIVVVCRYGNSINHLSINSLFEIWDNIKMIKPKVEMSKRQKSRLFYYGELVLWFFVYFCILLVVKEDVVIDTNYTMIVFSTIVGFFIARRIYLK